MLTPGKSRPRAAAAAIEVGLTGERLFLHGVVPPGVTAWVDRIGDVDNAPDTPVTPVCVGGVRLRGVGFSDRGDADRARVGSNKFGFGECDA